MRFRWHLGSLIAFAGGLTGCAAARGPAYFMTPTPPELVGKCQEPLPPIHTMGAPSPDSLDVYQGPVLQQNPTSLASPPNRPVDNQARVVAQFLVDSLGRPLPCSWRVMLVTDDAYVPIAFRTAMSLRFQPGTKASRPVAFLVEQAFNWGPK